MPQLPPIRLTGAAILRDGVLQSRSVGVAEGRITKGPLPAVDLSGFIVLPGIVDLAGQGFARHLKALPLGEDCHRFALAATDREAAAAGVTTAGLLHNWSWDDKAHAPETVRKFADALSRYRARSMVDMRLQLHANTHMVAAEADLLALVASSRVGMVAFSGASEEGEANRSPELRNRLGAAMAQKADVPRHLCRLAEAFDSMGVIYGSLGDTDAETRERFSMIGGRLSLFPRSRRAAATAKAMNDPVVCRARDVLAGQGSKVRSAPVSLIREGLCDALASGDHYASLASAAWRLADDGVMPFARAWGLISDLPAQLLRLPDRGRIEYGRRADLVVINAETRQIEATLVQGRVAFMAGEAARRFLAMQSFVMPLAAE